MDVGLESAESEVLQCDLDSFLLLRRQGQKAGEGELVPTRAGNR
jgi:hypothetical protein